MNEDLQAIAACHIRQFDLRRQYCCKRREQRVRFDESHTPFRRSRKTVFNFKQYHRRRQAWWQWRQANIKGTCRNIASIRSADQGPVLTFVFRSSQIGPLAQYQTQHRVLTHCISLQNIAFFSRTSWHFFVRTSNSCQSAAVTVKPQELPTSSDEVYCTLRSLIVCRRSFYLSSHLTSSQKFLKLQFDRTYVWSASQLWTLQQFIAPGRRTFATISLIQQALTRTFTRILHKVCRGYCVHERCLCSSQVNTSY